LAKKTVRQKPLWAFWRTSLLIASFCTTNSLWWIMQLSIFMGMLEWLRTCYGKPSSMTSHCMSSSCIFPRAVRN
jgi:hypothetical protein